jgi:hypothetical protein
MPDPKPAGIVVPGLKPAPAGDWWNTGCKIIHNKLAKSLFVLNLENQEVKTTILTGEASSFNAVFPWCNSIDEVATKAFSFHQSESDDPAELPSRGDPRLFYMFQNYNDNLINYAPADADAYTDRIEAETSSGTIRAHPYVDVYVEMVDDRVRPRIETPG